MAKMDEIMEVLTQEISGFNTSLEKLEALSKRLDNLQLKTDTSGSESPLENFLTVQKRTMVSYENHMEEVLKKIEKSRWTPKWEVALL